MYSGADILKELTTGNTATPIDCIVILWFITKEVTLYLLAPIV